MLKTPVEKVGDRRDRRQNSQTAVLRKVGLYVGVAFELPGTILGGLLVGSLLDRYLGTSPGFLIIITAIAFAGAFVRLIRWVKFFATEPDGNGVKKNDSAH